MKNDLESISLETINDMFMTRKRYVLLLLLYSKELRMIVVIER